MYRLRNLFNTSFQQLRWKLAFRYALITLTAFLIVAVLFILNLATNLTERSQLNPEELVDLLNSTYVPLAGRYFSADPPDIREFQAFLEGQDSIVLNGEPITIGDYVLKLSGNNVLSLLFLNSDRRLIGSIPGDVDFQTAIGERLRIDEFPGLSEPLESAQSGNINTDDLVIQLPDGTIVGVLPIPDSSDASNILGYLTFQHDAHAAFGSNAVTIALDFRLILLLIALFICVVAIVFGFLMARHYEVRIRKMMVSVQSWSRGDFSRSIEDPSIDELGRLARNLNTMVKKVEILLEASHTASVLEERKRLARDLHDSFKQQTFAASALLGAARSHFGNDVEEAEAQLIEAEKVLNDVRVGLTEFIRELRPSALEGRGLINAITEYSHDCADQNEIEIKVSVEGGRRLPLNVERTLFRIVQGALSNVVRHSDASSAEVKLTYDITSVTLVIADNGVGFDTTQDHGGLGIRSIRERVDMINGSLTIESGINKGTTITIKCIY